MEVTTRQSRNQSPKRWELRSRLEKQPIEIRLSKGKSCCSAPGEAQTNYNKSSGGMPS